jgi:hypothetical protein
MLWRRFVARFGLRLFELSIETAWRKSPIRNAGEMVGITVLYDVID